MAKVWNDVFNTTTTRPIRIKLLFLRLNRMQLSPLTAISPVDGRYFSLAAPLAPYFSELGLIRYRIQVETEYYIALGKLVPELKGLPKSLPSKLRSLYKNFNEKEGQQIKRIEKTTNHDVKAVEYFIKEQLEKAGAGKYKEFVHFGLTSQDINNTAIPLLLKEFIYDEYLPQLKKVQDTLAKLANKWKSIPMLARTHGQPASPTLVGKEILVFHERIQRQLVLLKQVPFSAKFGGATGNFNAHYAAYPSINWNRFADNFLASLGLHRSYPTTQIEHYDNLAALFDNLKRINTILIDLSRDLWLYITLNYFTQHIKAGEVGSSTMPHKINPIDFENAEGNLGFANANFEHLSSKLPVSRLQRDLTDSTVLRNVGIPMAHTYIAMKALLGGLSKIEINKKAIYDDLEDNWAVVAEGIQTILRKEGYPNPYEALKSLTRKNEKITRDTLRAFINDLEVSSSIKKKLLALTPFNYTGK